MNNSNSFDHIQSLINHEPLREMSNRYKIEERETEVDIFRRYNAITVDKIEAEIYRIRTNSGQTNKRKRIRDKERYNAEKKIKKRIRKEEMSKRHLRFRERYKHLLPNFTCNFFKCVFCKQRKNCFFLRVIFYLFLSF